LLDVINRTSEPQPPLSHHATCTYHIKRRPSAFIL
jgi:hypothetical protein